MSSYDSNLLSISNALGIDLDSESHFRWICLAAISCPLPPNWIENKILNDNNKTNKNSNEGVMSYFHPRLKILQHEHPMLERFRSLYQIQKAFVSNHERELMRTGIDPISTIPPTNTGVHSPQPSQLSQQLIEAGGSGALSEAKLFKQINVILNHALVRISKDQPPSTPEMLEALCLFLFIDMKTQFTLVNNIHSLLDLFVENHYTLSLSLPPPPPPIRSLPASLASPIPYYIIPIHPDEFISLVRNDLIHQSVYSCPEKVVSCQECEIKSARLKCEACKDFFCLACFEKTHATGKRKSHPTITVEQDICEICDGRLAATAVCPDTPDVKLFCDECYQSSSLTNKDLLKFPSRLLQGLVCFECSGSGVEIICQDCLDLFCFECWKKIHRRGRRIDHIPLYIDSQGKVWRGGVALSIAEGQILIDRARHSGEGNGPWIPFKDSTSLSSFWFNCIDKEISTQSPFALETSPA